MGTEKGYVALTLCETVLTRAEAIAFCFPNLNDPHDAATAKIVATTNEAVNEFNAEILQHLAQVYKLPHYVRHGADTLDADLEESELAGSVSTEFLNAQNENGVPPPRAPPRRWCTVRDHEKLQSQRPFNEPFFGYS